MRYDVALSELVLFFAFDYDSFRSKAVIMGTHMFTDGETPLLVFFESCTQWALCLPDVCCLAVCTADMVHKARLPVFTFCDFVLWSYQTEPNGVVQSYMGSHTCLTEYSCDVVCDLTHIRDGNTSYRVPNCANCAWRVAWLPV